MKKYVRDSIIANVSNFTDTLTNEELNEVIQYFVYDSNNRTPVELTDLQLTFAVKFFGTDEWTNHIFDTVHQQMWLKASNNTRENVVFIRQVLLSTAFFRFKNLMASKPQLVKPKPIKLVKEKDKLTPSDKKNLKEILEEHKSMLEYQLEDEDGIRSLDEDGDLLKTKKRHLKFIEKYEKL